MLSSDRNRRVPRRLAVLAGLALAACGFTPVYAPDSAGLALRDSIAITAAATPFDYRLRTALEDRLGRAAAPVYTLALMTEVTEVTAAIAPDGSITRFNLTGTASWTMADAVTGAELATGQVNTFTSYSATGTTVATRTAKDDATDRLAASLADLIVARLMATVQGL